MTSESDASGDGLGTADTVSAGEQGEVGADGLGMATLDHGLALRGVLSNLFGDEVADQTEGPAVGRFEVIRCLGTGGMGSVYEALDPKLDRRVAIKVLHADVLQPDRLVEEGKAMARLNHPNVVTVYEVDASNGRAFVAMELVQGVTLRRWQAVAPRSWREILAMYRQVGEGIEAAHRAGLVHCDLKPDNVLVGDDGRPRVADFGIAVLGQGARTRGLGDDTTTVTELTRTSSGISGTPRYMSPEQFRGGALDHRTDQFALCVMLWEALYGTPPFGGDSLIALAERVTGGERNPPTERSAVPAWLRRVCDRGLATEPDERWPDTAALLSALGRGQARARRRTVLVSAAALGVLGACVYGGQRLSHNHRVAQCEARAHELDAVWNPSRLQTIRDAVMATEVSHAAATLDKIEPWLETWTSQWREVRTEVCLRHDVERSWDEGLRERALYCLAERRAGLEVTLDELEHASPKTVLNAVELVTFSALVSECLDANALGRIMLPPEQRRQEVLALQREHARGAALAAAGKIALGREVVHDAVHDAQSLGWEPLVASFRGTLALVSDGLGRYEEAAAMATQAYFEGMNAGHQRAALLAALEMVNVRGERQGQLESATLWFRHASVLLDALDLRGTAAEGALLESMAGSLMQAGRLDEARVRYERSIAILEQTLGRAHPRTLLALGGMSVWARNAGQVDEAIALATNIVEEDERVYGSEHPHTATALMMLGAALADAGRYVDALSAFERAYPIFVSSEGSHGPGVGEALTNMGNVHGTLGQHEQAAVEHEAALEIMESRLGPDHVTVGMALNNLANVRRTLEQPEQARSALVRALSIFERKMESEFPHVAFVANNLADVEADLGNTEAAIGYYTRSMEIRERELGPDHPRVLAPLIGLSRVLLAVGRLDEATTIAPRITTLADKASDVQLQGRAQLVVLELRWAKGERGQAMTDQFRALRDRMAQVGPEGAMVVASVDRWLAEHT